jgi:ribosomal protein L11 methylase PrmA
MKEQLEVRLSTDGFLILSGILSEKAGEVAKEFSKNLKFFKEIMEEEWACLVFQNKI